MQTLRENLEILGFDADKLGFSPLADRLYMASPGQGLTGQGDDVSVVWASIDWSKIDIDVLAKVQSAASGKYTGPKLDTEKVFAAVVGMPFSPATSGLLRSFLRINSPSDVLKFTQSFGVLKLCEHGVPAWPTRTWTHPLWRNRHKGHPPCVGPGRAENPVGEMLARQGVTLYKERVTHWLSYVRIARAILAIGLADRAASARPKGYGNPSRISELANWKTLMGEWWGYPEERLERGFRNGVQDITADFVRMFVEQTVSGWIDMGNVRPSLSWQKGESKPGLEIKAETFGHIGLQLAATLATADSFKMCTGCGDMFLRTGRAIYCQVCRSKKIPARDRSRQYRQTHPSSSTRPGQKTRSTQKKGDSNEQER